MAGLYGEAIRLKVASPAVDGRANSALRESISQWVGVPLRAVRLISGENCRDKIVGVEGWSASDVRARLLSLCQDGEVPARETEKIPRENTQV